MKLLKRSFRVLAIAIVASALLFTISMPILAGVPEGFVEDCVQMCHEEASRCRHRSNPGDMFGEFRCDYFQARCEIACYDLALQ